MTSQNAELIEVKLNELDILQTSFAVEVARYRDSLAVNYIQIILHKYLYIKELLGEYRSALDEDGDDYFHLRAEKAEELMALIPEVPKDETSIHKDGMPQTRGELWRTIAVATFTGTSRDKQHAKILLKKIRLSDAEKKKLKESLKQAFEMPIMWEQGFINSLRLVNKRSEPLVIRALMHAAASRLDDDRLVAAFAR
jgi:hypothetical protein